MTRKRSKSDEKRQQIITAASECFLNQGFDSTSMDQVAKMAGVSKQTVYSHFGNKDELFSTVILHKCQEHEITQDLFDLHKPVETVLHDLAIHFSDLLTSDSAIQLHRIICTSSTTSGKTPTREAELFWKAGPQMLIMALENYLKAQVDTGRLKIANIHFASEQFLHMIQGEVHFRLLLGVPCAQAESELPDYLSSCVEVFLNAYRP